MMPFVKGDPRIKKWTAEGLKAREERKRERLTSRQQKADNMRGTRVQVISSFLGDLREVWRSKGMRALEIMAERNPERFCELVASLMPKQDEVEHTHHGAISIDTGRLQEIARRADAVIERIAAGGERYDPPSLPDGSVLPAVVDVREE